MTAVTVVKSGEVLEPGQRSLSELAEEIRREHRAFVAAGEAMLSHAICAGAALLQARARGVWRDSGWVNWLEDTVGIHQSTGANYMRFAHYAAELRAAGIKSNGEARLYLRGLVGPTRSSGGKALPAEVQNEARRLVTAGLSARAAARLLGISDNAVLKYTNPAYAERERERNRVARDRRRVERDRARRRKIERAAKRAGGALAEAYAMAERMQDVLGQAHGEATDREAREALSKAGAYYRKMRDEIVRALGVS